MADVVVNDYRASFEWKLARGQSSTTRTFSIDGVQENEAGISAAKAFRDAFLTGAGLSLSIIDPTKFWQPTGWRDNNPSEEPWDTVGCTAKIISTRELYLEGGESTVTSGRNIEVYGADDPDINVVYFTFDGDSSTVAPEVKVFYNNTWNEITTTFSNNHYQFTKTAAMLNAEGTIYVWSEGTLPADFKKFTITAV